LAGTIIGMVEKGKLITGSRIKAGDVLIGLSSNGLHTNGYSLARKILDDNNLKVDSYIGELNCTVADAFLTVHKSYLPLIQPLLKDNHIKGMAHITGGGIPGNLSRIIPNGLCAVIDEKNWETPLLFQWLKALGKISQTEMRKVFNLGIGMIIVTSSKNSDFILKKTKGILLGSVLENKSSHKDKVLY